MENELKNDVTDILLAFKIQPELQGFEFLRTGIMLCYDNPIMKNKITKMLYPEIAKTFNTSPEVVERGMRTAITHAYEAGGLLEINEQCQKIIYKNDYKWTNGELISTLVELLHLKKLRQQIKELLLDKEENAKKKLNKDK